VGCPSRVNCAATGDGLLHRDHCALYSATVDEPVMSRLILSRNTPWRCNMSLDNVLLSFCRPLLDGIISAGPNRNGDNHLSMSSFCPVESSPPFNSAFSSYGTAVDRSPGVQIPGIAIDKADTPSDAPGSHALILCYSSQLHSPCCLCFSQCLPRCDSNLARVGSGVNNERKARNNPL